MEKKRRVEMRGTLNLCLPLGRIGLCIVRFSFAIHTILCIFIYYMMFYAIKIKNRFSVRVKIVT